MADSDNKNSAGSFKRDQVVGIINSVISRVQNTATPLDDNIYHELLTLKGVMDSLRQQLREIQPADIRGLHVPKVTDELDAIVVTTEEATHVIMESCEVMQAALSGPPAGVAAAVEAQVTRIFEACTFQDLTGQRITKIVKVLREIDSKVHGLLELFDGRLAHSGEAPPVVQVAAPVNDEKSLMNGPQLPGQAISQDEIDKLLAEFS